MQIDANSKTASIGRIFGKKKSTGDVHQAAKPPGRSHFWPPQHSLDAD